MTTSTEKSYFDLHITGLGYLNRIREVKPKKGDAFLACDIAALNGPSDDVSYVRFDTRVSGSEAQHLVRRCIDAVEAEKKVMIGFRLGDLWTDIFTYSKGKNVPASPVSASRHACCSSVGSRSTASLSTRPSPSRPRPTSATRKSQ
jgi:hypothetical protein